jgi:hypothetical protein
METTTTTQTALKWGAIGGVASIVTSLLSYLTNAQMASGALQWGMAALGIIVMAAILWFAMSDFKEHNAGFMTYGQGLGIGSLIGGIIGIATGLFNYIYTSFVDTTFMDRMREFQMGKLEEQGMESAQIEQAMEMGKAFSTPGAVFAMLVIFSVLFYFIASLIVAAIQKRDKPVFN